MTKRVEIASRLLAGLLANPEYEKPPEGHFDRTLVDMALDYTDYLLACLPDEN